MPRTRLYRSIVVFGTSVGAAASVAAVSLAPACELYVGPGPGHGPRPDAWHNTIADAPWPIIDAAAPPDAWPIIADAPIFDAGPDAAPDASPDAAPHAASHAAGAPS